MNDLPGMRDEDIDRLLSGKSPEGGGFDDLAAFVRGVQATFVAPPTPDAASRHIAAAAAAAREAAASTPAVAGPATPPTPDSLVSRWRRRTVFGVSVATMALSISAAAIAATATGGLAAKGDLPGPVQRVVAQAASGVGITLPSRDAASAISGHGSGSTGGAPSTGSGGSGSSHQSQAGATPKVSSTSGRDGNDAASHPGGVRPSPMLSEGRDAGRGRDDGSSAIPGGTGTISATHNNCVTYAERIAGTLGLTEGQRSTFVSLVDHDPAAVTTPVAAGGTPDAACQSSINAARASAAASGSGGGDDHSGSGSTPSPTPTPTPTATQDFGSGSSGKATPSPSPTPSLSGHDGG